MGLFARLPPFWAVTLLLVGLTLPQGLLGLPIAAAVIGPLPALAVLGVVGVVMCVATAAEAEAIARDEEFRSAGFYGALVERFLGARAAAIPELLATIRTGMAVLGAYVGLGVTLGALTGAPREAWGAVTFVALAGLLLRGGIRIPPAVGALLGLACLPLLAAVAAFALAHAEPGNLTRTNVPLLGGDASLSDALGTLLGLCVMLYLSSVYVVQVAKATLPRAPDGRALVRGVFAGTAILTVLAGAWLIATSGAVDGAGLSGEVGTVLGPLAGETGLAVTVLGTALTILLLGLGIERTSVALSQLVAERLPERLRGARGRGRRVTVLAALAPLGCCVLGEVLLTAGVVSFTGVWALAGVATNILLSLALPFLLLLAARRSGLVNAAARLPLAGHPVTVAIVVAVSVALLALFATVLWDGAARQAVAAAALVALVVVVVLAWRDGSFRVRRHRAGTGARRPPGG